MIQRASVSANDSNLHLAPDPWKTPSDRPPDPTNVGHTITAEHASPLQSSLDALAARYHAVEITAADLNTASDTISLVSRRLADLETLVAGQSNGLALPLADAQRQIDDLVESIHAAAAHFQRVRTIGFQVEDPNLGVLQAIKGRADSPNPPVFDVHVEVRAAAQTDENSRNVVGLINGLPAIGIGKDLSITAPDYAFTITLTDRAAQTPGIHYAFRFNSVRPAPLTNGRPLDHTPLKPASAALADARSALHVATSVAEQTRRPAPDSRSIEAAVANLDEARAAIHHTFAGAIEPGLTHIDHDFQAILTQHSPADILALFPTGAQPHTLSPAAVLPLIRG